MTSFSLFTNNETCWNIYISFSVGILTKVLEFEENNIHILRTMYSVIMIFV